MTTATVLLADDDPVTLQLLGASLKQLGYRVITAMDAMQCLMAAHRNATDAILLDVLLPGGGGLRALKQLKANSQTQHIPVVCISSSDDATLPGQLTALGAEDFLRKPVDLARLEQVLHRVVSPAPTDSAGPGVGSSDVT